MRIRGISFLFIGAALLISCSNVELATHRVEIERSEFNSVVYLGQHITDDGSSSSDFYQEIRNDKALIPSVFNDMFEGKEIEMTLDQNKYFSNIDAVIELLRVDEVFSKKGYKDNVLQSEIVFGDSKNLNSSRYGVFFVIKSKGSSLKNRWRDNEIYTTGGNKSVLLRTYVFDLDSKELVGYTKYSDQGFMNRDHVKDILYSFISTFKYGNQIEPENVRFLRKWKQRITLTKKDGTIMIGNINLLEDYKLEFTTPYESMEFDLKDISKIIDEDTGVQLFPKSIN